jgi:hypothetical protein
LRIAIATRSPLPMPHPPTSAFAACVAAELISAKVSRSPSAMIPVVPA